MKNAGRVPAVIIAGEQGGRVFERASEHKKKHCSSHQQNFAKPARGSEAEPALGAS
jgi:hypothetical protein